jgi:predicted nucleic acid-binding protein
VLDASVTLAWFMDRSTPAYATTVRQLLVAGGTAVVPAVWQLEVANGFLTSECHGLLARAALTEMLAELDVVLRSIEIHPEAAPVRRLLATARETGLTAYDAAYLDLARVQQLPIATLDHELGIAARKARVALVQ